MRVGTLMHLTRAQRRLLLEATGELARASLELRFGRSAKRFGKLGTTADAALTPPVVDPAVRREVGRVGRAVTLVAGRVPWHPTCLRQALAARRMLARRNIPCRTHVGVVDPRSLSAHAWVTVGDLIVVGAHGAGDTTPLAAFG